MKTALVRRAYPIIYIVLGVGVVVSYFPAREVMKLQTAWMWVVKSDVTLNFVVLFFLYGLGCDKLTRQMSRKKRWWVWAVGLVLLIIAFATVGGMPTIFS